MSRISIDVTPEEHQRLKAMAALQGVLVQGVPRAGLRRTAVKSQWPLAAAAGRQAEYAGESRRVRHSLKLKSHQPA